MGFVTSIKHALPVRRSGENPANMDKEAPMLQFWRRSLTGITVNEDTALALTAVYRAVSIIASTIAALPLHIQRENQFGVQEVEEVEATRFIWDRPNPEQTRMTFWETLISHEVLNGNAYIFVVKNGAGQPLEIWPIEPWRVQVGRHNGRKVYRVDSKIPMIDYRQGGEIVHILNLSRDGLVGLSPIQLAASSVELSKAAEEYSARFFGQDSTPTGVLSTDKELTVEQAREVAREWNERHAGLQNRGIGVLSNGAKFQQIMVNPEDAQLLEERRFQVAEIARLFGVPPHLLADMERSTSWGSGLEEQGMNFLRFTLLRHIEAFEQAIDDALLRRSETRRKAKFVTEGLLRSSYMLRQQGHRMAINSYMTANEVRRYEGLPPIEGGDTLLAMTNLAPAAELAELELPDVGEVRPARS